MSNITQELVSNQADALKSQGQHPTARSIREKLGRGSLETIQKFLEVWRKELTARKSLRFPIAEDFKLELMDKLENIIKDVWASGSEAQDKASFQEKKELKTEVDSWKSSWKSSEEEIIKVEVRKNALEKENSELKRELGKKEGLLEAAKEQISELRARVKELEEGFFTNFSKKKEKAL